MNVWNSICGYVILSACRPVYARAVDTDDPKKAILLLNDILPKLYSYPAAMTDSMLLSSAVHVLVRSFCRLQQYDSALNAINEFQDFAEKVSRSHTGEWVGWLASEAAESFETQKRTVTVQSALHKYETANGPLGAHDILSIQTKLGVPLKEVIQIGSPQLKGSVCHRVAQYLEHLQREYGNNIPQSLKIATMESLPTAASMLDQQSLSFRVGLFMNIVAYGPEDDLYAFDLLDSMPGVRDMADRTEGMDDAHKKFVVEKLRLVNKLDDLLCPASLRISDVIDILLPKVSKDGQTYASCGSSFKRLLSRLVEKNDRIPEEATVGVQQAAAEIRNQQGISSGDEDARIDGDVEKLLLRAWTMENKCAYKGNKMDDAVARWYLLRRQGVL